MSTLFTDTPFHSWWWHVIHHHPPPLRQEEVNSRLKEPLFSHLKLHAAFFKHKNSFFWASFFLIVASSGMGKIKQNFIGTVSGCVLWIWIFRTHSLLLKFSFIRWSSIFNSASVSRTDFPCSKSVFHLLNTSIWELTV